MVDPIYFDLEAGGLGSDSSILSVAWQQGDQSREIFAHPEPGSWLSAWSEENILPQMKGKDVVNEKTLLSNFMSHLEHNPDAPLVGFNIGPSGMAAFDPKLGGFDLRMLGARYGENLNIALGNRPIRDVGIEARDMVAEAAAGFDPDALEYVQRRDALRSRLPDWNKPDTGQFWDYHKQMSRERIKGWQQSNIMDYLGEGAEGAHNAQQDVKMTKRIAEAIDSGEFAQSLALDGFQEKYTKAKETVRPRVNGGRVVGATEHAAANARPITETIKNSGLLKLGLGIGAVVGMYGLFFSGKDDNYNTVEGLRHGGSAQDLRRKYTDFGSGYRGPVSVPTVSGPDISAMVDAAFQDGTLSPDEESKIKREITRQADRGRAVQVFDKARLRRAMSRVRAGSATYEGAERSSNSVLGDYSNGRVRVGTRTRDANNISMLDPRLMEETVLHEGMHDVWNTSMSDKDRATMIQYTRDAMNGTGVSGKAELSSLARKSAVYRDKIAEGDVEYVANELFAHRTAAMAAPGGAFVHEENRAIDAISRRYADVSLPKSSRGIQNTGSTSESIPFTPSGIVVKGYEMPQEIVDFRNQWYQDDNTRATLEEKRKGNPNDDQGHTRGQFLDSEIVDGRVDLSGFDVQMEDGDTLSLQRGDRQIAVRMVGMDTPETTHSNDPNSWIRYGQEQEGGREAGELARSLIKDKKLTLKLGQDQTYGRYLGVLEIQDGDKKTTLQEELLKQGAAARLFFEDDGDLYDKSHYRALESEAIADRRGIWDKAKYRAWRAMADEAPTSTTFNSFTDKARLASNYNQAAALMFMEQAGRTGSFDPDEARRLGHALDPDAHHKSAPKQSTAEKLWMQRVSATNSAQIQSRGSRRASS